MEQYCIQTLVELVTENKNRIKMTMRLNKIVQLTSDTLFSAKVGLRSSTVLVVF